jgi:hypothetical protein
MPAPAKARHARSLGQGREEGFAVNDQELAEDMQAMRHEGAKSACGEGDTNIRWQAAQDRNRFLHSNYAGG